MKVTITGGTGFIGRHLCKSLSGIELTAFGRSAVNEAGVKNVVLDSPHLAQSDLFPDGDVFLHLGGYAGGNSSSNYSQINVDWPHRMVQLAVEKKYRHFVFMSSAKVHGDVSKEALTKSSPIKPYDTYSESKLLAEEVLCGYSNEIAITILRPPAVYGTPAIGGFGKLVNACKKNKVIPICRKPNKRSFISVTNIASIVQSCISEQERGCRSFLIHENETVSTERFIELISDALNSHPKRIHLPPLILNSADELLNLLTKRKPLCAIYENFYIKCNEFEKRYRWVPEHSTKEGVEQAIASLVRKRLQPII